MFWMLREAGASYVEIAPAAGFPRSRVQQICPSYAYQLHRRSEYITGKEPFMEHLRLVAAQQPSLGLVDSMTDPVLRVTRRAAPICYLQRRAG
jgi:hypothetical protein